MKLFKGAQKGFTLVELMVVMAIIAVLAAIVIPPVTGTKQVSSDSAVKQDASAISSAVSKYNADQNLAQNTVTIYTSVLGTATEQVTSNKWPETTISAIYSEEFPTGNSVVTNVTLITSGNVTYTDNTSTSLIGFVNAHNVVNFTTLTSGGYIQQTPNGYTDTMTVSGTARTYNNYLWLLKEAKVDSDATAGRVLEVYSLTTVTTSDSTDALTYKQVY